MGRKREIAPGDVFGRMTVVMEVPRSLRLTEGGRRREFILICSCGTRVQRPIKEYLSGRHVSCGCAGAESRIKAVTTHGMSGTRVYKVWAKMRERCDNPKSQYYGDYGGRGISYAPEWANFSKFWEDMGPTYRPGLELDRVDPNDGYCVENCRWVTEDVQAFNQRVRSTNTSGRTGVYKSRAGTWWAEIQREGKTDYLGTFRSFEDACSARSKAEMDVYGFTKDAQAPGLQGRS